MLRGLSILLLATSCGGREPAGLPPADDWGSAATAPAPAQPGHSAMTASCIARAVVRDINQLEVPALGTLVIETIRRDAGAGKEVALRALATAASQVRAPDHRALLEAELAFGFAELGKHDDARALAREAVTHARASEPVIRVDRDRALDVASLVLAWTGDVDEARAVAASDTDRQAHVAIGRARAGDGAGAIASLRAARDARTGPRSFALVEAAIWAGVPDIAADEIAGETDYQRKLSLAVRRARAAVERRATDAAKHIDGAVTLSGAASGDDAHVRDAWLVLSELAVRHGDRDLAATLRARARSALDSLAKADYKAKVHRSALAMVSARAGDHARAQEALAKLGTDARARLADSGAAAVEVTARRGDLAAAIELRRATAGVTSTMDALLWSLLDAAGGSAPEVERLRSTVCP